MGTVAEDNDGLVRRMCAYNKAISEPVRMKMIKALGSAPNETLSVGEAAELLHLSQPLASKHLKILYLAEFVSRSRQGTRVLYTLDEVKLADYYDALNNAFRHKNTPCINGYECDSCPRRRTCV